MSEIFLQDDVLSLLDNRFIVIIGDSIQRGVYKDLVLLLQKNRYLTDKDLRAKGEFSFSGDKLIEGGQYGEMTNGVQYREVRQYQTDYHLIRFYFITRCYNGYMESILKDLSRDPQPDVVIINSCLWDISRYGASSVEQYKKNLETLFKRFSESLPKSCLVIWNMTLPISKKARGGVLIPEVEHLNVSLRLDILEANFYVHKLALQYGFNTLDLHYYLRHQLQRRAGDGVHWDMTAHRRMSNLLLTHMAEAWGVRPPDHARQVLLKEQPLKETSNRPKNFNNNFNFGLNSIPLKQFTNNALDRNYMDNVVNNGRSSMVNSERNNANKNRPSLIGNEPIPQMFDLPTIVRQQEHLRKIRQEENLYQQNVNFQQQSGSFNNFTGPSGNAYFSGVDMSGMRIPDNMEMLNHPYGNQNFEPGLKGHGFGNQQSQNRGLPYRVSNRGLDPACHAYSHAY